MERLELCFGLSFQSLVLTSNVPLQEDLCHPKINIITFCYVFFKLEAKSREIFTQGEGTQVLVQLSINFKLSCGKKVIFLKQLVKKLIDHCTRVCVTSPCLEISLNAVTKGD